jgi:hypothetical protein
MTEGNCPQCSGGNPNGNSNSPIPQAEAGMLAAPIEPGLLAGFKNAIAGLLPNASSAIISPAETVTAVPPRPSTELVLPPTRVEAPSAIAPTRPTLLTPATPTEAVKCPPVSVPPPAQCYTLTQAMIKLPCDAPTALKEAFANKPLGYTVVLPGPIVELCPRTRIPGLCRFICRGQPGRAKIQFDISDEALRLYYSEQEAEKIEEAKRLKDLTDTKLGEKVAKAEKDLDAILEDLEKRLNCEKAEPRRGFTPTPGQGTVLAGAVGGTSFGWGWGQAGLLFELGTQQFLSVKTGDRFGRPITARTAEAILTHYENCTAHERENLEKCAMRHSALLYIWGTTDSGIEDVISPRDTLILGLLQKGVKEIFNAMMKVWGKQLPDEVKKKMETELEELLDASARLKSSFTIEMRAALNDQKDSRDPEARIDISYDKERKLKDKVMERGEPFFVSLRDENAFGPVTIEISTRASASAWATGRRISGLSMGGTGWAYVIASECPGDDPAPIKVTFAYNSFLAEGTGEARLIIDPEIEDPEKPGQNQTDVMRLGGMSQKAQSVAKAIEDWYKDTGEGGKALKAQKWNDLLKAMRKLDSDINNLMEPFMDKKQKQKWAEERQRRERE